jgi:hypothetical protein
MYLLSTLYTKNPIAIEPAASLSRTTRLAWWKTRLLVPNATIFIIISHWTTIYCRFPAYPSFYEAAHGYC